MPQAVIDVPSLLAPLQLIPCHPTLGSSGRTPGPGERAVVHEHSHRSQRGERDQPETQESWEEEEVHGEEPRERYQPNLGP